jgi:hypothetical protein
VRGNKDRGVALNIVVVLALCLSGTMPSAARRAPPPVDPSTLEVDKLASLAGAGDLPARNEIIARANNGDILAEDVLGNFYHSGLPGLPRDDVVACTWWHKAIMRGNKDAEISMGWCFETGTSVPQSFENAKVMYWRAGDVGANDLARLLADHPELKPPPHPVDYTAPERPPVQVASAQPDQSAQATLQQETAARIKERQEEIADKIQELQSDIEEHESAVETWNDTLQTLAADNSNCSGISALICQGIGQVGVAKAQAERNKELNAARADRAEISRLQGETAQLSQRLDESFAGNLQQVVSQSGTAPNTATNPQSLAIQRQLGAKPNMDQETRHASPQKGCWNGKNGAASGIIPGSQSWSACPAY